MAPIQKGVDQSGIESAITWLNSRSVDDKVPPCFCRKTMRFPCKDTCVACALPRTTKHPVRAVRPCW